MKVLFVSAGFLPAESHGGVPFSTYNLASSIAKLGCDVRVITTDRNGPYRLDVPRDRWHGFGDIPVWYASTLPGPYIPSLGINSALKTAIRWADIVISSSTLWDYSGFLTQVYCQIFSRPHVVYPRGLLDPWAFRNKRFRKTLFWHIQGKRILQSSQAIVALSPSEKKSIEALGVTTPVEVIPNGSPASVQNKNDDGHAAAPLASPFRNVWRDGYVLFLGRICEKKGLKQAVSAYNSLVDELPDSGFVIAGPIDKEYASQFSALVGQLPKDNVRVLPPLAGEAKSGLIRDARGFILTSFSEGLPMAVLEAMACRIPVIVTPECNISGIEQYNAGWVVPIGDIKATRNAILECFRDSIQSLEKGRNAARLISERFEWESIGRDTLRLLDKLIAQTGER